MPQPGAKATVSAASLIDGETALAPRTRPVHTGTVASAVAGVVEGLQDDVNAELVVSTQLALTKPAASTFIVNPRGVVRHLGR